MRPERWSRVRELFERAVDVPRDERARFLDETTGDDTELRSEVERLLAAEGDDTGFLAPPDRSAVARSLRIEETALDEGARLGSYRVVRRLGSGGMGTVYEAEQQRPARTVALKVLRDSLAGDDARRRFQVEAEVLGRLRHPGLATVYEMGEQELADGRTVPFFALEFVDGARDLVTFAREERLDTAARVELFREVCAAVHHAHLSGVLHRDLKPDNLLVGADGRAKVIDYGVARAVDPAAAPAGLETRGEHVVGTLQYMAPEQLSGGSDGVDARADVYALGLVLYELLSGARPYEVSGRPLAEVVHTVCQREVPAPGLGDELDWIVLCALARDPRERYESVAELSRDLGRYRAREPVLAAPPSAAYRARKFVARNRAAVIVGALVFAGLLAAFLVTTFALIEAGDQRDLAREALFDLEEETRRKQEVLDELAAATAATQLALERQRHVADVLRDLLAAVSPKEDGYEVTLFELLERTEPSFDEVDDALTRVVLAHVFGDAYAALGLTRRSGELYARGIEAYHLVDDPDPAVGAKLHASLARIRSEELRSEEAAEHLDTARALLERVEPEAERVEAGLVLEKIRADVAMAAGDLDGAVELQTEALERYVPVLGSDDENVLWLRIRRGTSELQRGNFSEARDELEDVRARAEAQHGPDHPVALEAANGLTQALHALGRTDEALEYQLDVVERSARVYGEHSVPHVHAQHSLMIAYLGERRPDLAEPVGAEALRVFDEEHFTDLELEVSLRSNHAIALGMLGRGLDAAGELERVAEILVVQGHAATPRMYEVQANLGEALWVADELDGAADAFARMRSAAETAFGPDSWQVHFSDTRTGALLVARGRADEGVDLLYSAYGELAAKSSEAARQRTRQTMASVAGLAARAGERGESDVQAMLLDLLAEWGGSNP